MGTTRTTKARTSKSQPHIVSIPLAKLKPYKRNPRKNDQVVDRMVASIQEFGFKVPILARSSGDVVDGHLRLKAAAQLNLKTVPVILCDEWSAAQVKAFRLMANRSVGWAEWDLDLLKLEMKDLELTGLDLSLTGFDANEIDGLLLAGDAEAEAEEATPALPTKPVSRARDLWILGKHRLLCGDCTTSANVARLCGNVKPSLMVTDPPYGVDYDPDWRNRADRANGKPDGARAIGLVTNDDTADWSEAYSLFPGDIVYVWHAAQRCVPVGASLISCGFDLRYQLIWMKQQFAISRGHYHWQHESCWYAVRNGKPAHWAGDRKQTTVWQIDKPVKSDTGHSTQKPVECMRRPIVNHTKRRDAVYDPFVGSGTTIIAAESIGRICYAIELSPAYVDVAVQRWQQFTGKQAILDGDGRAFEDVGQRK